MTPQGATPEMSGLYINSNNSSLSNSDWIKNGGSGTEEMPKRKPSNDNSHYIVIKSSVADTDPCGATKNCSENPMYMTLEHAAFCIDENCHRENCQTLKQFLIHYNSCSKSSGGGCTICFALDAIVCQVRIQNLYTYRIIIMHWEL